ncbi:hypothetical protein PIIN_01944 [Serendipita indica DSM 11827]|uniref:F-box domain-containing protein n=1 Tax=Serendipita indica (strain DSM 11827) TaxID=1109443 RepID=G4T9S7_SERID|nr:hypothetical protein PIIN_01944 [Serendipita indica DSM 11827]
MALIRSSDRASAEIWHQILQEAIHVPIFLDPDPVPLLGPQPLAEYSNERPYWESQRTLNALRRVCSSWNTYLAPMAHRYVALRDIVHGHVALEALRLAYRVEISPCPCNVCRKWRLFYYDFASFLEAESFSSWRIQILRVQVLTLYSAMYEIARTLFSAELASLRCIISDDLQLNPPIAPERIRGLSFYMGPISQSVAEYTRISTLNIALGEQWLSPPQHIPTLRHLAIASGEHPHHKNILKWLETIGRQLITFCWTCNLPPSEPMSNALIWDLLPSVTYLQLPNHTDLGAPPSKHPIEHLRIHLTILPLLWGMNCTWCDSKHACRAKFPSFLYHSDGSQAFSYSYTPTWNAVMDPNRRGYLQCYMGHFLSISPHIKFVDDTLVSLEEHVPNPTWYHYPYHHILSFPLPVT